MISVIIPLYNKEKTISRAVNSVLNQTYRNFEVIIVNDGSTDKSLNIAQSIPDNRIKIITKENGGVSSARNMGIKMATYDYIAFLDSDDMWLPWHLQNVCRMINEHLDAAIGAYSSKLRKCLSANECSSIKYKIGKDVLIDNYIKEAAVRDDLIHSSNWAVKKSCFYNIGFYNESLSYGEDVEFYYRLFKKYKLVNYTSVTAVYVLDADNRSDKKVFPLSKRFHEFYFAGKPEYEKRYLGKLVFLIILDYSMLKAYNICIKTYWRYKRYTYYIINYFFVLLKKRISKSLGS